MDTHSTHIDCGVLGEQQVSIEYDYQPEEKEVLYPTEDAYPGCAESVEITSIVIVGYNYQVMSMPDADDLSTLEEEILLSRHDDGDEDALEGLMHGNKLLEDFEKRWSKFK